MVAMQRHIQKHEFNFIAITVMLLEVAAFIIFTIGALVTIYGAWVGVTTLEFFTVTGIGAVVASFFLLAFAEFLQLLMKIEYNTRKTVVLPKNTNGKKKK